jgi:Vault protein inter-alpha-trypsin domain
VVYSFPLPAKAAVFRCELIVNGRVIQARVEERQRARDIAKAMKDAGHRVGLVEQERDNLFTLSLGNVQPNDLILVRFAWFEPLYHLQKSKLLRIPFTPGVRYIPGTPLLRSNSGHGLVHDTAEVPDASRISPPRIDQLHPEAALVSIAGIIHDPLALEGSISSPSHPLILDGLEFRSIEAFYVYLLFLEEDKREKVRPLYGIVAKRMGKSSRLERTCYRGEEFDLGSETHFGLIKRAIRAKLKAHPVIADAFVATRPRPIVHNCGRPESKNTKFPASVFCSILTELREELAHAAPDLTPPEVEMPPPTYHSSIS